MPYTLNVNGRSTVVDAPADMPLLWVLRDVLNLKGTKYGCGIGQCRACTVHVDGTAALSCQIPVVSAQGRKIVTIEGVAHGDALHPVQKAWLEEDVPQCGYCQSGQIMAAAALLARKARPSNAEIEREVTNLCRCGTYHHIRQAIQRAVQLAARR